MNRRAFMLGYYQRMAQLEKQAFDWGALAQKALPILQDTRLLGGVVGGIGGATLGGLVTKTPWGAFLGGAGGAVTGAGGAQLASVLLDQQRAKTQAGIEDTAERVGRTMEARLGRFSDRLDNTVNRADTLAGARIEQAEEAVAESLVDAQSRIPLRGGAPVPPARIPKRKAIAQMDAWLQSLLDAAVPPPVTP
jgi:hypothetical protein